MSVNIQDLLVKTAMAGLVAGAVACGGKGGEGHEAGHEAGHEKAEKHEEKHEEEGCYRTERFYGSFSRAVPLPVDVDLGAAEAKFDKGVLTVRFPKKEGEQKQQRIPVS